MTMAGRRKPRDEDQSTDVGIVMTVSLFLILLTFFILLNSIAVLDDRRTRVAIGSLTGAFGSFSGGLSPLKTGETIMPPSPPLTEEPIDLRRLLAGKPSTFAGDISIETSRDQTLISVNEDRLFTAPTTRLKRASHAWLDRLCSLIREGDYAIEIMGHTDNRPAPEKGYGSNWEHSSLMALQILKYMIRNGDIPAERITAFGGGSHHPIRSNDTVACRAQNRRVDIVLKTHMPPYFKRIYTRRPAGFFTYKKFNFKVF